MGNISVDYDVLNQKGSPAWYSDVYANIPAPGYKGRMFISTDTYAFYRDNGTGWDLVGGPGTGTITGSGASGQVTYFNGSDTIGGSNNLFWDITNARLGINTNAPGVALDLHATTGVVAQFENTTTNNTLLSFRNQGAGVWSIGNNYSGGINDFIIYDAVSFSNRLTIKNTGVTTLIGTFTATSLIKSGGTSSQILLADGSTTPTSSFGTGSVTNVSALTLGTIGTDLSSSVANSTTTPVITLNVPTASATNRGVLSNTDWTTFNNKQATITLTTTGTSGAATLIGATLNIPNYTNVGTVTNVSALTLGTTGTDLSSSVANSTTTPVITLNVPTASATNRGALSSTDWTTFNNKQATISVTSPVVLTGATISMPVASTGVSGYLSSTDWNTFNNKSNTNGTVTSVAALTLGTTGVDLSSSVATGTTTPVITLNVPTASATNRGALSSTDWTTFNNKQATISVTSPVVLTGATISMPVASTGVSGYLSSTDWNTFNNKSNTNGTVTSVAALTLGTTGVDLSSSVATGTTTPVITLNVPTASASNRGALSSTDWTTFNGKVGGSGTTGTIPKFVSTTGLGNSLLSESGTAMTIGGSLNINAASGTGLNVAGNTIVRGDTGVGTPRQLLITAGGGTPVYLEAKGYGANYVTDFGIKVSDNAGTQTTPIYCTGGNGFVGIGTTSPSFNLQVLGGTSPFKAYGSNGNGIILNPSYNYYDAYEHIFRTLNGVTTTLNILSTGYVYFGALPSVLTYIKYNFNVGADQNIGFKSSGGLATIEAVNDGVSANIPIQFAGSLYTFGSGGNAVFGTSTDNGQARVQVSGAVYSSSIALAGITFSTSQTASKTAWYYIFTGGAGITLTLPSAASNNAQYMIKNKGTSVLTIAAASGETITPSGLTTDVSTITLAIGGQAWISADGGNKYYQLY